MTTSRPLARGVPASDIAACRARPPASAACRTARCTSAAGFALRGVRPAGDPDAAAPVAGRGHDRPGARRHHRRHARPVRQHRPRPRSPRPGRAGRTPTSATTPIGGLRAFLSPPSEAGYGAPIKWQFIGPVTLGVALVSVPACPPSVAFAVAARAVRSHVAGDLRCASPTALPPCPQIVLHRRAVVRRADEPGLPDRPRPGDRPAVGRDGVGSSRRPPSACTAAPTPTSPRCWRPGPRCCRSRSHPRLVGRRRLPRPVPRRRRTDGVGRRADRRSDRARSASAPGASSPSVWCELVQRRCDRDLLRAQRSLVTPACGLGLHTPSVADRVCPPDPRDRAPRQRAAVASRFALGV